MACLCTDLLDDLYLKFELILELVNTVIGLIRARTTTVATLSGGASGGVYHHIETRKRSSNKCCINRVFAEDEEILAIILALLESL